MSQNRLAPEEGHLPVDLPAEEQTSPASSSSSAGCPCSSWSAFFNSRALFCVLLFVGCFGFFATHNTFKFYYHPDEPGKVRQIALGKRNFNHPLMMLTTTRFLMRLAPVKFSKFTSQDIVVFGRYSSVLFLSVAAVALAWMAWSLGGPLAGWCSGIFFLLTPPLYEFAHFMKEDPSLVMGLTVAFLSFHQYWNKPTLGRLLFVGLGCALAASGKYLGLIVLPFALALICMAPAANGRQRLKRIGIFLLAFLAVFALLNYPMLKSPGMVGKSLTRETDVAMVGHKGLMSENALAYYLGVIRMHTPWPLLLLACLGLGSFFLRWKSVRASEWLSLGCIGLLAAAIASSPKVSLRYALPLFAMVPFYAGLGIAALLQCPWCSRWRLLRMVGAGVAALLCIGVGATSIPVLKAKYRSMGKDDRMQLREFVRQQLPPSAVIAQDERVGFPLADQWEFSGEKLLAQKVLSAEFSADLGTFEQLRAKGVTHVALCQLTYSRFFTRFKPSEKAKADFERRRQFYQAVQEKGKLVWSSPAVAVSYTQPGLSLYDISGL